MMEKVLKEEEPVLASPNLKNALVHKAAEVVKTSGPPPTAPKGPASSKPIFRLPLTPAIIPTKPKSLYSIEKPGSIAEQLERQPYLFVPAQSVPVMVTTPPHMKKRMRHFNVEDVLMDREGYYITFTTDYRGRNDCERCYRALNGTLMFNYPMMMEMFQYGTCASRPPIHQIYELSRRRSRTPTRRQQAEEREKLAEEARRKEEEADIEEEKKERAYNFDPAREAIAVIRRELREQLVNSIRKDIGEPHLFEFMNPSNHLVKRRKLNISDPADLRLSFEQDDDDREDTRSCSYANLWSRES